VRCRKEIRGVKTNPARKQTGLLEGLRGRKDMLRGCIRPREGGGEKKGGERTIVLSGRTKSKKPWGRTDTWGGKGRGGERPDCG